MFFSFARGSQKKKNQQILDFFKFCIFYSAYVSKSYFYKKLEDYLSETDKSMYIL